MWWQAGSFEIEENDWTRKTLSSYDPRNKSLSYIVIKTWKDDSTIDETLPPIAADGPGYWLGPSSSHCRWWPWDWLEPSGTLFQLTLLMLTPLVNKSLMLLPDPAPNENAQSLLALLSNQKKLASSDMWFVFPLPDNPKNTRSLRVWHRLLWCMPPSLAESVISIPCIL